MANHSQKRRLLLFALGLLVIIVSLPIIFWKQIVFFYQYWDNPLSVGYSIPYISLNNPKAMYMIKKDSNGQYIVEYIIGKGVCRYCNPNIDDTRHVAIGSSKISLDSFIGKKVLITGQIRRKLGKPLAWTSCREGNYI